MHRHGHYLGLGIKVIFTRFKFTGQFLFVAFLLALALNRGKAAVISSPEGVSVQMDAKSGSYQVTEKRPPWRFAGSLNAPLKNVTNIRDHDSIGNYQQIAFSWRARQASMSGWIRVYDQKGLVLFSQTCVAGSETPPPPFPAFDRLPQGLHTFSYGHHEFAPPDFVGSEISTPWLLFDNDANAFVISPASHFMVASMIGSGGTNVASGFNPELRNLPSGFTQNTLVVLGNGINKTWDLWGRALLELQHAKRPAYDADAVLKYLGYWTDNGAAYYYNYKLDKGYTGTLQSLVEHYRQEQIPIRYLQLDSWWYYKTTTDADGKPGKERKSSKLPAGEWNRYGGLLEYRAHQDLFPNGLGDFQKTIGLPLVTHNRWIDPASPYHQRYKISGVAAVDPKWWDDVASYLKTSGTVTYEQDWLDRIFTYSPGFSSNADTAEAFLDNMARACREQGMTVQYCMPYPCYFMQGSRYENLTTVRTSEDRFNTNRWNDFLYTSRLAAAMGIWPWADVYMSAETNNVLLSTLSAGPVGIGDAIGVENKANLLRAVRADGVIVKPDAPIVPFDSSYIADAQKKPAPLVSSTYTDHRGIKTEYIFAFNRPKVGGEKVRFTQAELGLSGNAYVYNYFSGKGKLMDEGGFSAPLGENATAFYVVAPVGKSGIAFLGDRNKFVGTGKQRITSLHDETGKLTIGVVLADNEKSVTLHGYAAVAPKVTIISGLDDAIQYDPATHYFSVEVNSDAATPVNKSGADPVRELEVVLDTQSK